MSEHNDDLLKESLKFIDQNPNILSNDVPQKFIDFWRVEDLENLDLVATNSTQQGAIFIYTLMKQKEELGGEFKIRPERLIEVCQNWQIVLNFLFVSKLMNAKLEPFKLFDFEGFDGELYRLKSFLIKSLYITRCKLKDEHNKLFH